MRRLALSGCALLLVACTKSGDNGGMPQADTTTSMATPPAIALADVAGTWNMRTLRPGSDSAIVNSQMIATADTSGWQLLLPDRDPIPFSVHVDGDSIMMSTAPYESVLRPGAQVSIASVMRLHDGMLVGSVAAHYATDPADSVVTLRVEGSRAP